MFAPEIAASNCVAGWSVRRVSVIWMSGFLAQGVQHADLEPNGVGVAPVHAVVGRDDQVDDIVANQVRREGGIHGELVGEGGRAARRGALHEPGVVSERPAAGVTRARAVELHRLGQSGSGDAARRRRSDLRSPTPPARRRANRRSGWGWPRMVDGKRHWLTLTEHDSASEVQIGSAYPAGCRRAAQPPGSIWSPLCRLGHAALKQTCPTHGG